MNTFLHHPTPFVQPTRMRGKSISVRSCWEVLAVAFHGNDCRRHQRIKAPIMLLELAM